MFYFNLVEPLTIDRLSFSSDGAADYALIEDPAVAGGAGASFDFGVDFGSGAGPSGNGTLKSAGFTLGADGALSIDGLMELSHAAGDALSIHMAAHVQSTSLVAGADSETVGGGRCGD